MNYSPDKYIRQGQRRVFEAFAVILLSLATVGSAWCSYQASAWGTRSTKLSIQSSARGRDAATFRIKANQFFLLDIHLFSEYVKAYTASNQALARFYSGKFRPEFKVVFDDWMQTQPFENPEMPLHPFLPDLYHSRLLVEADVVESDSERLWGESDQSARTAHSYILVSVMLATALFFAGTAPQFETYKARRIVLALGLIVLLTAASVFAGLPLTASTDELSRPRSLITLLQRSR